MTQIQSLNEITELDLQDVTVVVSDPLGVPDTGYTTLSGIIYGLDFPINDSLALASGEQSIWDYTSRFANLFKSFTGGANWAQLSEYKSATETVKGISELATIAEVSAGEDTGRTICPDALAGSVYGKSCFEVKVFSDDNVVATGDGKFSFIIPTARNGYNLVEIAAYVSTVSSSGAVSVAIYNVTDSHDVLSVNVTIDANEKSSYTAATAPTIDTSYDDVATGDELRIDVDGAGTGAKGLTVVFTFQKP